MSGRTRDEEYEKAMTDFSVSSMNNAKWVRLFSAIVESGIQIERAEWKYVGLERTEWNRLPLAQDILPNRFADGAFQPTEYKWIEWVFVPAEYAPVTGVGFRRKQDVAGILEAIDRVGKFDIDRGPGGFRLYGYRP